MIPSGIGDASFYSRECAIHALAEIGLSAGPNFGPQWRRYYETWLHWREGFAPPREPAHVIERPAISAWIEIVHSEGTLINHAFRRVLFGSTLASYKHEERRKIVCRYLVKDLAGGCKLSQEVKDAAFAAFMAEKTELATEIVNDALEKK